MTREPVRPHRPVAESARAPALRLISDYPRYWAEHQPGRETIVFESQRWRYPELADRVDRCAKGLLAAGVRRGDRVATLAPPHPDFVVTFLAAASIGAIWLGLNPRYQRRELDYVLGDATPVLVFARQRIGDRTYDEELAGFRQTGSSVRQLVILDGEHGSGTSFQAFEAAGSSVSDQRLNEARAAVDPKAPCLIVYTSGTTGQPKGALINHHGLVHVARVQNAIWRIDPIRVVNNLPINHIGCVGDLTCDTLVPGGTLIFAEQFDPGGMLELVERERATMFGHVPTALQLIVSHPRYDATDMSSVQLIIWEGAAAPRELIGRLKAKCPQLANAYGMTETVGSVTFTFDSDDLTVLADSVGWPVPEYGVRLAAADGTLAAPGDAGEIQVQGDFVTLGYWNKPEATRDLFTADGWLKTGDLAKQRPDGSLQLIGRLKEMFKSGGYNVYPREIELVLESHPDVAMAAVIGVPDQLYQEVGHAFLLVPSGRAIPTAELREHCKTRLANYKVPKHFTVATEFPMLPIGKIDKQALKRSSK